MFRIDLTKAIRFVRADIWRIRTKDLPRSKSVLIRLLRVFLLTIRGVTKNRFQLRASALTFYSLLSVVPVVAMVFGIAKGFGFEKKIQTFLTERLEGQEQVVTYVVEFSKSLLEDVKGGLVAGIGIIILLYTIIKILSHIENAFNDIWGVVRARTLARKITDYLSLILISPVLLLISSAATVLISKGAAFVFLKLSFLGVFSSLVSSSLKFLPYCVLWVLFTFLYIFIPNTKVKFRSGLLGGIIGGTMYEIFQWVYINFQVNVAQYNAIYGSFAALPLFFIWLQLSWLIVLLGAEIAFAHQNVETYEFEQDCMTVSHGFRILLSLRIVHLLVNHFSEGKTAWTASQISHRLEIPIRLVNQLIYELTAAGILSETALEDKSTVAYQPAMDPERMTVKFVIDALEKRGSEDIPIERSEAMDKLAETLEVFGKLIEKSPANKKLKD
ncbi:MAG: YihY/virulence factor BrkB family protein, partial [Pseudomonadota bacterium]